MAFEGNQAANLELLTDTLPNPLRRVKESPGYMAFPYTRGICHRVNPLILKRAISHILPQLPFYLFFLRCPSSYFFSFLLFLSYQFMVMGSTP